jgi:hypothetical protein
MPNIRGDSQWPQGLVGGTIYKVWEPQEEEWEFLGGLWSQIWKVSRSAHGWQYYTS